MVFPRIRNFRVSPLKHFKNEFILPGTSKMASDRTGFDLALSYALTYSMELSPS